MLWRYLSQSFCAVFLIQNTETSYIKVPVEYAEIRLLNAEVARRSRGKYAVEKLALSLFSHAPACFKQGQILRTPFL